MKELRNIPPHHTEREKRLYETLSFSKIRTVIFIVLIGILIGYQIYDPSKRVIEAIVGLVLIFTLWQFSELKALWFLLIIYPFPFSISLGNSNFIFVVLFFIIYLVRVSAGRSKFRSEKYFNLTIILLVLTYVISFYNITPTPRAMKIALIDTGNFFATVLFFYLIINFIDTEEKLKSTIRIFMISITLVIMFTLFELIFPGKTIIPAWLYTMHEAQLVMKGLRIMGPFHDYELVAEFFTLNALIIFFMLIRARRLLTRSIYAILLTLDLFMMFATITRGAIITLIIGLLYLAFLSRRDMNFVRLITISAMFVFLIFVLETFVARYTMSGSLFDRLIGTTIEKGFIPDTRTLVWDKALNRAMEHPIIGHGPGLDFSMLRFQQWRLPHSVYLFYLNMTGIVGLSVFMFLVYRLIKASSLGIKSSLIYSPFSEAFMKVLHVCLVMFLLDQIKIEYLRNDIYVYFIWFFFGLIASTRNIILKKEREQPTSTLSVS